MGQLQAGTMAWQNLGWVVLAHFYHIAVRLSSKKFGKPRSGSNRHQETQMQLRMPAMELGPLLIGELAQESAGVPLGLRLKPVGRFAEELQALLGAGWRRHEFLRSVETRRHRFVEEPFFEKQREEETNDSRKPVGEPSSEVFITIAR